MSLFQSTTGLDLLYLPKKQKVPFFGKKPKVIVIAGPTAVGKTRLSLKIADILDGEIISADSMQVYRGMDIGTDKAGQEDRGRIPHHLIDIREVDDPFNVVEFYEEAHSALREILFRKKAPIVVGGSGFYIHTFLYGPPLGPPSDKKIRQHFEKQIEKLGLEVLYEQLQLLDPEYAKTITENDQHKIVRALEIIAITKKPVSMLPLPKTMEKEDVYDFRCWFLTLPKEKLFPKIEKRCEEMLAKGLLEEVKTLLKKGLENNPSASQAIGYRQCIDYLKTGNSSFKEDFFRASKAYVKRQLTWFKKEEIFRWLDLEKISEERVLEYILQDYEQA